MSLAGITQIREILFGATQRELDRRIVRADAHLVALARDLAQETRRRTEVLEGHIRRESEALSARLERALAESGDAIRRLTREQHEAIADLEHKFAKAEESSAHGHRDLRDELLQQAKAFFDELQRLRTELLAMLQQELGLAEGELVEEPGEHREHSRH